MNPLLWKPDWAEAQRALQAWWDRKGLALSVTAPKDEPWENIPLPERSDDPNVWWMDAENWAQRSIHDIACTFCGGVAFPSFWTCIGGPGSLGLFLGAEGHPAPDTMWYTPSINDPDSHPPLRIDRTNPWWKLHVDLLRIGLRESRGRFLVGYPDLIENMDTLGQLREPQDLLVDLLERPDWAKEKLAEINRAFFECYDEWWPMLRDPWGGGLFTAFGLWAPGKVAKVQCDFSCMISEGMFREFVFPPLWEQCEWLDYSMYHLDGTQAMHHLPALLEIEALDAIEWTPQAGLPGGGSPRWYDLYRRIKKAGKGVQAVRVEPDEVLPLIDAVGPEGMYIVTACRTEKEARDLLRRASWKGNQ